MQDFYFIVTFAIPLGQESEFRQQFNAITEQLRHAPDGTGGSGTLYEVAPEVEVHLLHISDIASELQNRPEARASFHFVLLSHWESLAQYEAVLRATASDTPITFPAYPAYYRLAVEYQGSAYAEAPADCTFINPFEVSDDQEEAFVSQWRATIEHLHTAPGVLSARLFAVDDTVEATLQQMPRIVVPLQHRTNGRARFRFVGVSQGATVSQYETAVRTFGRSKPLAFSSHPAFYQAIKN